MTRFDSIYPMLAGLKNKLENRRAERDLRRRIKSQRETLPILARDYFVARGKEEPGANLLKEQYEIAGTQLADAEHSLELSESGKLTRRALRMGIEIPQKDEWWRDNAEEMKKMAVTLGPEYAAHDLTIKWLSEMGRVMVAKLIKEERRKNIEWWVKIITPVLAALISLLGLVVALVSVSRK